MISEFSKLLNNEIKEGLKSGFLREEYFATHTYNYQSEVHSRILGLIVRVLHSMGLEIEIERGFNYLLDGKNIRFKPDIVAYKKGAVEFFIEYESTNSSDARFYDMERSTSDLRCLEYFGSSKSRDIPRDWVVILTLPRTSVERSKWHSWEFLKSDQKFEELIRSPFDFYFQNCVTQASNAYERRSIYPNLHLLNIDRNELRVEKSIPGVGRSTHKRL